MEKLNKEISVFKSQPHAMQILLLTNLIYSLVIPVIELFIGAYIIRNSADFSLVMVFQLAQATGIPVTFFLNGLFLKKFPIRKMYSTGMILSSISMALMMLMKDPTVMNVLVAGLIMGFSYGFFWSNRTFLALTSTTNANRNYYYGLETFFSAMAVVIVPAAAGAFIATGRELDWFPGRNTAYHILTGGVFLLTVAASVLLHRAQFKNPAPAPLLFFTFHRLWKKMLGLALLKGIANGYIITAPVMLIMNLVGSEGSLGLIQSLGASITAVLLYILGRKTGPQHRLRIFALGLFLFLAGSAINALLYSAAGVLVFVACLVFARPLLDLAYFPIQLGVTERVAEIEKRNKFTYIFRHELGLYAGRLIGCSLFIVLYHTAGNDWALRYALLIVSGMYLLSLVVARSILNDPAWDEPAKPATVSVNEFKEPIEL
ncbi:MFS transporter [Daejeonella lutea]|uniref:MFS transporter, YQGE family, putative transporter n=1 Tax=Daejeonella lutea TaxID=572036 RepID=A0A1T5CX36_9SPHI|nr:MFS transporter [Daejeonella lutea]SKB63770.1 MFS transporter, YQGE family, putative transporter [Daejeonella lutea]